MGPSHFPFIYAGPHGIITVDTLYLGSAIRHTGSITGQLPVLDTAMAEPTAQRSGFTAWVKNNKNALPITLGFLLLRYSCRSGNFLP